MKSFQVHISILGKNVTSRAICYILTEFSILCITSHNSDLVNTKYDVWVVSFLFRTAFYENDMHDTYCLAWHINEAFL